MKPSGTRFLLLFAVLSLSLAGLPRLLAGEEMPEETRAHGRRETVLAGIDLAHGTLPRVRRLYGPPDRVDRTPTPPGFAETEYVWERPGRNRLAVRTRNAAGQPERLVEIDVWGAAPTGRLGRTGRGLALGSTLRAVEKIYGRRYVVLRPADPGPLALWLAWDEDYGLHLDFDRRQRVQHIQVARNEED